jgi:hypothetical protein
MKKLFIGLLLFLGFVLFATELTQAQKFNLTVAETIGHFYGLPPGLAGSLAFEESTLNAHAMSTDKDGNILAVGLFQINVHIGDWLIEQYFPGEPECFNIWGAMDSAILGCAYLADLYERYNSWEIALWAYNWGPGNVENVTNISEIPQEVKDFAIRVLSRIIKLGNPNALGITHRRENGMKGEYSDDYGRTAIYKPTKIIKDKKIKIIGIGDLYVNENELVVEKLGEPVAITSSYDNGMLYVLYRYTNLPNKLFIKEKKMFDEIFKKV